MTIRRRILLLSGTGAAVLTLALLQFYRLWTINAAIAHEAQRAESMHQAVLRIDLLAYEYLLYGEPRARRQLTLQCQRLARTPNDFSGAGNRLQQAIVGELQRTESLLTELDVPHIDQPASKATGDRSRYLAEQFIIASHEMFDHARRWQQQMVEAREGLLREATISAIVASSLMLVLLMAGALLLLRTIVRPVDRLRRAVAAVADGDLSQQLPVARRDELGVLTVGFNQMTAALAAAAQERERAVELEARTAALERINRELEQFAAVASHDLQAPLRSISSYTDLLLRLAGPRLDERSQTHLQRIIDATDRMRTLIESLLRFARAGTIDVAQDTDLPCRAGLDHALENLRQLLHESGAVLDIGALPVVHFDGVQLIQLFQNIIGNALKYRDHERPLRIRVWAQAGPTGYHAIAISDNGPGIPIEQHERIFGMFQRAHGSDIAGSGIGLALCRKIVEHRGGSIRVESPVVPPPSEQTAMQPLAAAPPLTTGATFIFTVPAVIEPGSPPPSSGRASRGRPSNGRSSRSG